MRAKNSFLFLILITAVSLKAQTRGEFFPKNLLVQPFVANIFEPRLGFDFHARESSLELNISNSIEIYRFKNALGFFSFGADLFTFTRLRREAKFHFPVDAVDYLFGVNFSYLKKEGNFIQGFRLRFSHISAHFADGHFDNYTHTWHGNRTPIVYSREFVELTPFLGWNNFRFYLTVAYVYHIDPDILGRDYYQLGFDYHSGRSIFIKNLRPFFGYDFRLNHLENYTGNHSLKAGLKFGEPRGRGISVFLNYFKGNSFHGEYYNVKRTFFSIGLNLDI